LIRVEKTLLLFRFETEEKRKVNAALLLREIPMILYVSILRQGIPSDDSLRFCWIRLF